MKTKKIALPKYAARYFKGRAAFVQFGRRRMSWDDSWETLNHHALLRAARNFRVWKKVRKPDGGTGFCVIALTIPKGTRFWAHGDEAKCRAERAIARGRGQSKHDQTFLYAPGKEIKPKGTRFAVKDCDACAAGIHFFATESAARRYNWT